MGILKHIVAIFIVFAVLVLGYLYLIPASKKLMQKNEVAESSETVQNIEIDTLSFQEKFEKEILPLQATFSKRKKRTIWTLGGGKTVITYLLEANRAVKKLGGEILFMQEIFKLDPSVVQGAQLDILSSKGDTLKYEFQISRNEYKLGESTLAVGFQVKSLTDDFVENLNAFDFPFSLLIPPFGMDENSYKNLQKIENADIILWMTMESKKLTQTSNALRPVRIHHTEEQIETIVNDAFMVLKSAKGVASKDGEQAVEHKKLMQAFLKPLKEKKSWFLDITMNSKSQVLEICKDMNLNCKKENPYDPDHQTLADYIHQKIPNAKRNGSAVMILPLSKESLNMLKDLDKKTEKQGTTLTNLSTFMKK